MENVADALKMAGSVLLFVVALSVAILSFSQARKAIDAVLKFSDRESLTIEGDDRFYYLANPGDTNRYVGKETIIPAIYRAYKENYKIIFKFPDDYYLYEKDGEKITTLDANQKGLALAGDEASKQFVNGILYHDYENPDNYDAKFSIKVNRAKSLFDYLTDKENSYNIRENLGTYNMEDVKKDPADTSQSADTPEANKTEKEL